MRPDREKTPADRAWSRCFRRMAEAFEWLQEMVPEEHHKAIAATRRMVGDAHSDARRTLDGVIRELRRDEP